MNSIDLTPNDPARNDPAPRPTGIVAGAGFLLAFLALSPAASATADRALPLPTAPAQDVADYFVANPLAAVITASLQVVSVLFLVLFIVYVYPAVRRRAKSAAGTLRVVGFVSVAAMLVSSAIGYSLAAAAPGLSVDTVASLQQVSFYAGGAANIVLLGAFVFGVSRVLGFGQSTGEPLARWVAVFGYVAGGLAVLSILSVPLYFASPLLPVGRVLCMVWTIFAGVSLWRRRRSSDVRAD